MELTQILTVILLISASVLCIALIYFVFRIVKSVHSIRLDLESLSFKLTPLIESMLISSEKINHISNEVESQLQISKSIVSDIRYRADKILNVETRIRTGIENALMPIIKKINAVGLGVASFWKSYKHKQIEKYSSVN